MLTRRTLPMVAALIAGPGAPVMAQSDVSPTDKWSLGENIGWMNWRDAGDPEGAPDRSGGRDAPGVIR